MNQAKEIARFVRKAFSAFSISECGYFYDIDMDTGEEIPQELFFNDVVDDDMVAHFLVM